MEDLAIRSSEEYETKERRLMEIQKKLEDLSKNDYIDLSEVLNLRNEARKIAIALKQYLKASFEDGK